MIMVAVVQLKYDKLGALMDEKLKRRWAGCEALALGRGGISAVARATGLSRNTVRRGLCEVQQQMPQLADECQQRVRQPGGGRRPLSEQDPTLTTDLAELLDAATRGDPTSPLLWTCQSTRQLADALQQAGHQVSHMTVARLLQAMGYSLQANRKTEEGRQHPDRDQQFRFIARRVRAFQRRGQPVISIDAKHREIVGNFKNPGRAWRPQGEPERVNVHDFPDPEQGVAIPYGVYDLTRNEGWVDVGIDHDTAEFATATVARWWREMGQRAYPKAKELLITADSGGSNAPRTRLWRVCLQELADETGLFITVCRFPPGTSKWNKIEHRMFCHIAQNWRGRPLRSRAIVVNLIGRTTTRQGLRIRAELDEHPYPTGLVVSDAELAAVNIARDRFHGDWNYMVSPHIRR
jgi:hypothetical protein